MILKCKGRCSQSQLQNELKIDSAAVTRHLKLLEEKNLVKRERNKENNREVFVEITDKAKNDLALCAKKHDWAQCFRRRTTFRTTHKINTMKEEKMNKNFKNNDFSDITFGRKSVRLYDENYKISHEEMLEMIQEATAAPSSVNATLAFYHC